MAILGLGLIAVGFCLLVYQMPPRRWLEYLRGTQLVGNSQAPRSNEKKDHGKQQEMNEKEIDKDSAMRIDTQAIPEQNEDSSTPQAGPGKERSVSSVPLFNLHAAETVAAEAVKAKAPAMPAPSKGSVQTRDETIRGPTTTTNPARATANSLMPPPAVRPSALRPLPKHSGSPAPPPSAASSMRGPPRGSGTANGLSIPPSTSTLPPNKRPSRKVQLEPGHSPLDWAYLTRNPPTASFLRGADVPPRLIKVTPAQLKRQNGRKGTDAWGTYQGKVYNLSPYLKFHPGGVGELLRGAGKVGEAERLFIEIHPWVNWDGMLSECLVGILVSEEPTSGTQDLEAMD